MTGPSSTVDQNILPVQAYFNLDGSFNTFIGQGQPFVVSATESKFTFLTNKILFVINYFFPFWFT